MIRRKIIIINYYQIIRKNNFHNKINSKNYKNLKNNSLSITSIGQSTKYSKITIIKSQLGYNSFVTINKTNSY
jgi:hypothetical protein